MKTQETFAANTQYGDWKGTVAADTHDLGDIQQWLEEEGRLKEDDLVCGIGSYGVDENPFLSVLIFEGQNGRHLRHALMESGPIPLKRLNLGLSIDDFLRKFKRLDVKLSTDGCLNNRTITITKSEEWD